MWVLMWRPWPTWAVTPRDPEWGFYCQISIKALLSSCKPVASFLAFAKHDPFSFFFFFFNLDCTFLVHDCTCRWLFLWLFSSSPRAEFPSSVSSICFDLTAICSRSLKAYWSKQMANNYQGNWKMDTTHTSCIKIWMLKCFKLFLFNKPCNRI